MKHALSEIAPLELPKNSYIVNSGGGATGDLIDSFQYRALANGVSIFHQFDDIEHVVEHGCELIILGHCYNPFTGQIGSDVANQLLLTWLQDEENFYELLDELSGRFVILLVNQAAQVYAWPDACGTLPVCYHTDSNGLWLSSHACLIKEAVGCRSDQLVSQLQKTRFYQFGIRHCPADLTEVEDVRLLTPNLQLFYADERVSVSRTFPRERYKEECVDRIVEDVATLLKSSIECLLNYHKPTFCALSGGVDSRISLAATRESRKGIKFFTFSGKGNASRDLECTRSLAKELSLNFNAIELPEVHDNVGFLDRYCQLQGKTRCPNSEETQQRLSYFGRQDAFEIRSSVSEVARSFIKRKFRIGKMELTAANMVPLYKRVPFSKHWQNKLESAFDNWVEISGFKKIERLGYDWLDFYYWEYRVGTWQNLVMQDADYYTNPTVIFNNRKILSLMLSSPESLRNNDELQKKIMLYMDNTALDIPLVKNFGSRAVIREVGEAAYLRVYCAALCR